MNAQQLYLKNGKSAEVAYCGKCKVVHRDLEGAEKCCAPGKCRTCETACDSRVLQCSACVLAVRAQRLQARVDKAEKIPLADYDGEMVYVEDAEKYVSTSGLLEWCDEQESPPRIVFATTRTQHMISAENMIDGALDEAHDGAYDEVSADAIAELDAYVRAWSLANLPCSYYEDTTRVIAMPQSEGAC